MIDRVDSRKARIVEGCAPPPPPVLVSSVPNTSIPPPLAQASHARRQSRLSRSAVYQHVSPPCLGDVKLRRFLPSSCPPNPHPPPPSFSPHNCRRPTSQMRRRSKTRDGRFLLWPAACRRAPSFPSVTPFISLPSPVARHRRPDHHLLLPLPPRTRRREGVGLPSSLPHLLDEKPGPLPKDRIR